MFKSKGDFQSKEEKAEILLVEKSWTQDLVTKLQIFLAMQRFRGAEFESLNKNPEVPEPNELLNFTIGSYAMDSLNRNQNWSTELTVKGMKPSSKNRYLK